MKLKTKKLNDSRRKVLKSITAGSGAVVAGKSLPESWSRPIVDSVMLPLHAATSGCNFTMTLTLSNTTGDLPSGGAYPPQSVEIRGSITPNPGAGISIVQEILCDGVLADLGERFTDANGEFSWIPFSFGNCTPGAVELLTHTAESPFECATASWSATLL